MEDFKLDTIRDQILLILIANEKTYMSIQKLYNLMKERIDNSSNDINIKEKYIIIYRSLPKYNKEVKFCENINFIVYDPDIKKTVNIILPDNTKYTKIDDDDYDIDNDYFINKTKLYNYIIDNYDEDIYYREPITGNTLYHDIIINNNEEIIDKLMKSNKLLLLIENNNNKTPLSLINDRKLYVKIIEYLYNQNIDLNNIIRQNELHIKTLNKKLKDTYKTYYNNLLFVIAIIIPIILYFFNFNLI